MKVGVIGSGLAGLAAACTLAARGHEVHFISYSQPFASSSTSLCLVFGDPHEFSFSGRCD